MTHSDIHLPEHIAVIPDGNRRWAKQNGLSTKEGHKAGYDNLKRIAYAAFDRGVGCVTAYAFSTENWLRTEEEVKYLMGLLAWVVTEEAKEYHRKGIRLRILGSRDRLSSKLVKGFEEVQNLTKDNRNGAINICFNYGGRLDLVDAMRQLVREGIPAEKIDEGAIASRLSSAGLPDPDLIIRTSGERRLSNFLLWESAYSELYFSDVMWPAFSEAELDRALADYANRKRNFGK